MSTAGLITMLTICGVVWGGFALLLTRALEAEARKSNEGSR